MPLNKKGEKIKDAMEEEYGEKKGKKIFYASENKGSIKGIKKDSKSKALKNKKEDKYREEEKEDQGY